MPSACRSAKREPPVQLMVEVTVPVWPPKNRVANCVNDPTSSCSPSTNVAGTWPPLNAGIWLMGVVGVQGAFGGAWDHSSIVPPTYVFTGFAGGSTRKRPWMRSVYSVLQLTIPGNGIGALSCTCERSASTSSSCPIAAASLIEKLFPERFRMYGSAALTGETALARTNEASEAITRMPLMEPPPQLRADDCGGELDPAAPGWDPFGPPNSKRQ